MADILMRENYALCGEGIHMLKCSVSVNILFNFIFQKPISNGLPPTPKVHVSIAESHKYILGAG